MFCLIVFKNLGEMPGTSASTYLIGKLCFIKLFKITGKMKHSDKTLDKTFQSGLMEEKIFLSF